MKRAVMLLLILILIPGLSFTQDFWQQTNGPYGGKIHSLTNNYFSGLIFAGTDSGVYRTDDYGDRWTRTGLTDSVVTSMLVNSIGQTFAGTSDSGLFLSEDYGTSWTQPDNRLKNCSARSLAFNPIENTFLGTADSGIFRSPGFGIYWVQISTGQTEYGNGVVTALACYSSGHIYAGINAVQNDTVVAGYVYHSSDNGDTWPDTALVGSAISSLASSSDGILYAGTREDGVFRSTDYGNIWTPVNSGLTDNHIGSLTINSIGHIFVATDSGVYRSINYGNNWTPTGLKGITVRSMVNNIAGYVFAGSDDGTMYRSIQSTTQVEETSEDIPSSFALKQNYPNPFNPITTIEFNIPNPGYVSLKVFNITGQTVASIVSKKLNQGSHTCNFDGGGLASGIYYYQLVAGEFHQVKKMILLR